MDTVNVLILYGGEKATASREMLLSWLNSSDLHSEINVRVDAQKVAAMVAHMEGSIDQRVEERMNWADKGIFLLTPDERSEYGAPNVLEEFGRWIGQKGRRSMLTLRHEDVKVHSNAQGLVYVSFKFDHDVITKCSDRIKDFVKEVIPKSENSGDLEAARQIINNSTHYGNNATVGDNNTAFNIDKVGGRVTGGDSIGGNVYHIAGDLNIGRSSVESSAQNTTKSNASTNTKNSSNVSAKNISITDIRSYMTKNYNMKELKIVCMELDIEPDEFDSNRTGLILDLIPYLRRRNRLRELVEILAQDTEKPFEDNLGARTGYSVES